MNAQYINPFLASSVHVIETMIQVKPSVGQVVLKPIQGSELLMLRIGIIGQIKGDVVFCFPQEVAMKIVSSMMGGYPISELDDMCMSAIAELGNMISGNASTMLSNEGIAVDITPPDIVQADSTLHKKQALTVPLVLNNIGEFDIYMIA
ncbi:chemotaxis protein CheX [Paenibacillus sambharensis]|uniref:Chemotaxis protein CheX n=1 Tax=Paenibacillus sambharensis TaxID=1803190 RepID=A0A2W1L7R8_9BACL|nr:chemotaxis protein CheX [Paenibacillus sambharensis]PZD96198.1 chemotaxis protein CheX [Paenibacillus sambharensis]